MTVGELNSAKRRALNMLDAWLEITDVVSPNSPYYYELQGVVEDAVECGAQAAIGVHMKLESEAAADINRTIAADDAREKAIADGQFGVGA